MSTMSLRLPGSLHRQVRELAQKEGISINQLITTAPAEKLSALLTEEHLEARARRGSRERFDRVLATVPGIEPEAQDPLWRAGLPSPPYPAPAPTPFPTPAPTLA